jgi:endonuclease/exonuclease/phosphatase family metal-dependent hydrolase
MKSLRLLILTTLALTLGSTLVATPAHADAVEITIGQFNMAGGHKDFGPAGDEAPDALVRSIQGRNPKLAFVTVQEGCRDWLERLDSELPDYTFAFGPIKTRKDGPVANCKHNFDPNRDDDDDFGNAIIYRDDFGIDSAPMAHSLGSPAESEQREMLCLKSEVKKAVICSAHLSSGDEGADERLAEAARAKEILATDYAGYTVFVGGDLNDHPLSDALDNFYHTDYQVGATGQFKEVDSSCRNEITEKYLSYSPLGLEYKYCRDGETTHGFPIFGRNKFDYMFVTPTVFVREADVTYSDVSDHDPLWADVTVTFVDGGGSGGGGPVDPVDFPPTVDAGPAVSGDEGSTVELLGSASDRENAPTVTWSYEPVRGVDEGTSCTIADPHAEHTTITCSDDGVFAATLTASDGINPAVSDTTLVTIRNAPPRLTLTGPSPWQVFRAGTPVNLTASFTDAANDTHTCTVNWDDNSTDVYAPNARTCDRAHTFAAPGMYTIKVTVTDDDGASASASVMVVVYNPDAGFVTSGTYIDSPAGALASDPTATGRGSFQFNPSYQNGEQGPPLTGGKVSFKLDGTDLSLDASDLEWLVVTPDGKAVVKGASGGYGFVLYGSDEPDKLRIVVWPLSAGTVPGDTLTYDNRRGAGFDMDVADLQLVTGGNIQLHG